jgi:hypothetical protein
MKLQMELVRWNELNKDLDNLDVVHNSLDHGSDLYNSIDHIKKFIDLVRDSLIIDGFSKKELYGLKKYKYSVTTNTIWASIDYGEVEARSYEEAKKLAIKELDENFKRANYLLKDFANIGYDKDEITIEEIK